ncbi:MAG: PD-(D/E)XK nuclease family protein [Candidatus Gygaella obscura]|nr:PD-(D/E)XK nuclease family protein [Candidatus Gygaella obscura]
MTKLSRSKLELFVDCPRCFWLDVNRGIKRPPPAPYTINSSIDYLLKKEFDECRKKKIKHYLFDRFNLDLLPFDIEIIDEWRNNFKGVRFHHEDTDFLVFGALDDVWVNPNNELFVVDYKATGAKEYKIYDSYKRQMEVYQWLLRKNNFNVSETGYFLFCKVNKDLGFKQAHLSFDLAIEPLVGNDTWIEKTLFNARQCLNDAVANSKPGCKYCNFVEGVKQHGK